MTAPLTEPPAMTTPSAVDEIEAIAEEISRIQWAFNEGDTRRESLRDLSNRVRRLRQPVSDAEVSALEGRIADWQLNPLTTHSANALLRDCLALLRRRTAGAWQTIETVPVDESGGDFLALYKDGFICTESPNGYKDWWRDKGVTHWMPLPATPAAGEKT